jgi:hypothetical protein
MRLKSTALCLVVLAMAVTLAGCRKNTVNLVYYASQQKIALHPNQGDVLLWTDIMGGPITTISFPLGIPCASVTELQKGQCTISVPNTGDLYKVPYLCPNCLDPEIVIGSDSSLNPPARASAPPTGEVQMACLSKQVTIYPSQVTIPLATVKAGTATVRWEPGGVPPVGSDWTTNDLSSICSNGSTFSQKNGDTCNLRTTATGTTSFTVSSTLCNNTNATGTIVIQ